MVSENTFIKEFFLVSNIYRLMSNYVKQQLKHYNIPINETQLNLLFLMHDNHGMSGEDMLTAGNFALSTLLFNINNLQNTSLLDRDDGIVNNKLHKQIHVSKDGSTLLAKIENIFKNNSNKEFYDHLILYEAYLHKSIKNKKIKTKVK